MARAQPARPYERADKRTDPARPPSADPKPTPPAPEDVPREYRDQRQDPGRRAESELHGHERPHACDPDGRSARSRGAAAVDARCARRVPSAGRTPGARRAAGGRRGRTRPRPAMKAGSGPNSVATTPPCGGADGEHRAPERAAERVGGGQVRRIDHVGQGRRRRRDRRRRRRPTARRAARRRATGCRGPPAGTRADHRARQVAGDHQPAPVQSVGEPPRPRGRQEDRDLLREDHESRPRWPCPSPPAGARRAPRTGTSRRRARSPRPRKPTEVAVAPQEVDRGAGAGLALGRAFAHRLPDYLRAPIEEATCCST